MYTIGELIERVNTPYNKGVASISSRLRQRYVYNALVSGRNTLITQQIKKKQLISDWNYIILDCIELIKVDSNNCPCLPSLGCKVYRTKYKLPKILTDLNIHLIKFVMNIENGISISETSREDYLYNAGNKYTNKNLKYILEEGHLYIYGKNIPKMIRMKFLPENPIDALTYPSYCKDCVDCEDCESMTDKIFPIDGDMVNTLIELVQKEILPNFIQGVEDETNNAQDTIREQSK